MKHVLSAFIILLCFIFSVQAQSRLKPARSSFSIHSDDYDYDLRKLFFADTTPELSFIALPSFENEYALILYADRQKNPVEYTLTAKKIIEKSSCRDTLPHSRGSEFPESQNSVETLSAKLPEQEAIALIYLFEAAIQTMQTPDLRFIDFEVDGTTFLFSYNSYSGTCFSPHINSNCGRLANVTEQILEHIRTGGEGNELPKTLIREISSLTRVFKSLRTAKDMVMSKYIVDNWETGDNKERTLLVLRSPYFQVTTQIASSMSKEQALDKLIDHEPGFQEIARRLYMQDEVPYLILIEVLSNSEPESAAIIEGKNRYHPVMSIRLQPDHLSPDTFMHLYDYLATVSREKKKFMLNGNPLSDVLKN